MQLTQQNSFIRSFVNTVIHSYIQSFIHSFICTFIYSFIYLYIHSFVNSFIHSFIHPFIQSFILSFIHATCVTHSHNTAPVPCLSVGRSGRPSRVFLNRRNHVKMAQNHWKSLHRDPSLSLTVTLTSDKSDKSNKSDKSLSVILSKSLTSDASLFERTCYVFVSPSLVDFPIIPPPPSPPSYPPPRPHFPTLTKGTLRSVVARTADNSRKRGFPFNNQWRVTIVHKREISSISGEGHIQCFWS